MHWNLQESVPEKTCRLRTKLLGMPAFTESAEKRACSWGLERGRPVGVSTCERHPYHQTVVVTEGVSGAHQRPHTLS